MGKSLIKYLRNIAIVALVVYVAICGLLYIYQDDLLFHTRPMTTPEVSEVLKQNPDVDAICFTMADKASLTGYFMKDTDRKPMPLIIYFGGNAEEVSQLISKRAHFKHCALALINYRGYGQSTGSPSEKTMFSDALEVYDHLKMYPGIDSSRILVLGRSIGIGVATYLASERNIKATMLITPYESMIAVAQEKYPFVPIRFLINHPFESQRYAANITTPVLALIAKNDAVIPKQHAYNLLKHWKGKSSFLEVDADHNSIIDNEAVWRQLEDFIAAHTKQ
jgi:pimeloyl-ACP methyl ester carboxylesterase